MQWVPFLFDHQIIRLFHFVTFFFLTIEDMHNCFILAVERELKKVPKYCRDKEK